MKQTAHGALDKSLATGRAIRFETEGVILQPVTTGEARKFLVWTVPDSLRRNEVGLFLMTVRILPKDALTMIQMEPDHSDPVWEATKNNVLN